MVVGDQFNSLVTLPAGKEPTSIHWIGGRISSRAGQHFAKPIPVTSVSESLKASMVKSEWTSTVRNGLLTHDCCGTHSHGVTEWTTAVQPFGKHALPWKRRIHSCWTVVQ
jgi:hypothetical protein